MKSKVWEGRFVWLVGRTIEVVPSKKLSRPERYIESKIESSSGYVLLRMLTMENLIIWQYMISSSKVGWKFHCLKDKAARTMRRPATSLLVLRSRPQKVARRLVRSSWAYRRARPEKQSRSDEGP